MIDKPPTPKFASRFGDGSDDAAPESDGECDDLGAFGLLRGLRDRAEMLELRKKTGNIRAVPYGWIEKVDLDPSDGITLYVGGEKIKIRGRNLNLAGRQISLLGGIIRHRVAWIAQADRSHAMQAKEGSVVVDEIDW
jgi:hypothetical protein